MDSDQLKDVLDKRERDRLKIIAASPRHDALGRRGAMSLSNLPNPQLSQRAQALDRVAGVIQSSIEKVQSLYQRVKSGKKLHEAYDGFIGDLMRERVPPFVPQLAEGTGFAAGVFSLQWRNAVMEVSLELAKPFGPEFVNQAVDRFHKARQSGGAGSPRKASAL